MRLLGDGRPLPRALLVFRAAPVTIRPIDSPLSSVQADARPPSSSTSLPDVQGLPDARHIAIDRVGVSKVRFPVSIRRVDGSLVPTVAELDMTVSLPADRKGTHMSRFLEVLQDYAEDGINAERLVDACRHLRTRLDAHNAFVTMRFTHFIEKAAPVTGRIGLLDYDVVFDAASTTDGDHVDITLAAAATSLCPCSKEISEYGAHNQRCRIAATVRADGPDGPISLEELAGIVESAASCEVYSVLKRPDEKFVTEEAYRNPKFVEDIIRDLAIRMDQESRVRRYLITSENFESIHGHNAFAQIERVKG